jgi:hypothetical protein
MGDINLMATHHTSSNPSKLKKPRASQATNSIMHDCCSQAIDIVFQDPTRFSVLIEGTTEAPSPVRITSKSGKFCIVGLTAAGVNKKTKPWQIYVVEAPEESRKKKPPKKMALKTPPKKTPPAKKATKKKK